MNQKQETIEMLRRTLLEHSRQLLVAGLFGSAEDDLDVLLVLSEMGTSAYADLCRALQSSVRHAFFFPTFRLESLCATRQNPVGQRVHLLAYPCVSVFHKVERPFTRYCIARSFRPWIGNREQLCSEADRQPAAELDYYANLLFETVQVYSVDALPSSVRLAEVRKKLMYIVKFSCLEVFLREDSGIDLGRIADTVFSAMPAGIGDKAGRFYQRIARWTSPTAEEVLLAFAETQQLLEELRPLAA